MRNQTSYSLKDSNPPRAYKAGHYNVNWPLYFESILNPSGQNGEVKGAVDLEWEDIYALIMVLLLIQ